jgi:DNA-binding response OmpR family regulator
METENKKILLVEDDQNFGAILKDYLTLNDFDVTLAKNGMEGFEKFKKDTYDLCILDVMMPYKDGYIGQGNPREKQGSAHYFPNRQIDEGRCT